MSEWDIAVSPAYRCECGGAMVSLVLQSEDGRVVFAEIPIACLEELKKGKVARRAARVIERHVKDERRRIELLGKLARLAGE